MSKWKFLALGAGTALAENPGPGRRHGQEARREMEALQKEREAFNKEMRTKKRALRDQMRALAVQEAEQHVKWDGEGMTRTQRGGQGPPRAGEIRHDDQYDLSFFSTGWKNSSKR